MRFNNLQSWLSWQESLHSAEIELGLTRVQQVASNMGIGSVWSVPVVTVAGTNGKGSSVAILESIYHTAGYRVGSYTSPHLLEYNERIKIARQPVSDDLICQAFEKIDQARKLGNGEVISLTYFEFGTLAALSILHDAKLDIVILEVGLGGRLDAVNIVDAAVALITPIAIDHQSWLGDNREQIGAEKAGIIKTDCAVVYNDPLPVQAVIDKVRTCNASVYGLSKDFSVNINVELNDWQYQSDALTLNHLPQPSLEGDFQLNNAAAAIQVSQLLLNYLPLNQDVYFAALQNIQLAGRFQTLSHAPDIIIDVAHNEHAVSMLANNLRQQPSSGKTLAVVAMLEDKAICEALEQIDPLIDSYFLAGLEGSRALSVDQLKLRIQDCVSSDKLQANDSVEMAIKNAISTAKSNDRIIIFGSFLTVSAALQMNLDTVSASIPGD